MNRILVPLTAAILSMTACTWNDYKPLDYVPETPQERDPEAYAEYLSQVRAFKESEHNIMMVGMMGSDQRPSSQTMHPMSMPDYADYIIVNNPNNLHPVQVSEIQEVYQKKHTKSLAHLDLDILRTRWTALEEAKVENGGEASTETEIKAWFKAETVKLLAGIDTGLYDGLLFSAIGTGDAAQKAFLAEVKTWYESNIDMELVFRGTVRNISDTELLDYCKYVIIIGGENSNSGEITLHVVRILNESSTKDRVLVEVTVPSADVPNQIGATPQIAAKWVVEEKNNAKFTPLGVVVKNGHDDYFAQNGTFSNIAAAIAVMNPKNE